MPRQSISNKVNVYSNKMWSKGLTPRCTYLEFLRLA